MCWLHQVAQHKSSLSAWVVAHGDVYDSTEFLNKHPAGAATRPLCLFYIRLSLPPRLFIYVTFASPFDVSGPKVILRQSGSDQTESFDFHSKKARKMWKEYNRPRPDALAASKTHFISPRYKIGTLVRCPSQPPPPASCGVM